jgi:hypothetical protein
MKTSELVDRMANAFAPLKPLQGGRGTPEFKLWSTAAKAAGEAAFKRPHDRWCFWNAIGWEDYTVIKRNMMSGEPFEIEAHAPRACDPSCELYWSM